MGLWVYNEIRKPRSAVMFEAFGSGKQFIGTKVGGVQERITSDGYSLLYDSANPKEEKILIASNKEWDYEKIRWYAERFAGKNKAKEIIKTYETVLLYRRDHGIA